MPFLFRRIIETFSLSIVCSLPIMLLVSFKDMMPSKLSVFLIEILSILLAIVFVYMNIIMLRGYISSIENKKLYYLVNGVVFALYTFVSLFLIMIGRAGIISWGFQPIQIFTIFGLEPVWSAAAMFGLFLLCMVGVSWEYKNYMKMKNEMGYIEPTHLYKN